MEVVFEWLRANVDVFGFGVACLIFLVTIFLVARKLINFWVTLLLLLFSLFAGLTIANQDILKDWLRCPAKNKTIETPIPDENADNEPLSKGWGFL